MPPPIYLDYNATTPVDPEVMDRMLPFFTEHFGNAASKAHAYGWTADEAVQQAREQVAALLGAAPEEIVFTSGSTEALSTAIQGVAEASARRGRHVVTTRAEHNAVLAACRHLERRGAVVTYLPVDADGRVTPEAVRDALRDDTVLVAVMWANNELGTLQPIPEIAEVVRTHGARFLTDATQAVGKVPVDVAHADLLTCSAHKCYGPKGVGALYVRRRPGRRTRLTPLLHGSQEGGLRGGTLNVPGIVGMGAAAEVAGRRLAEEAARLEGLRDRLEAVLCDALPAVRIHGRAVPRLPQTSSVTFPGLRAANLMMALRTLALSAGSACASGTGRPSHVLQAIGLSDAEALGTLRFSLGRFTTEADVEAAAAQVVEAAAAQVQTAGP